MLGRASFATALRTAPAQRLPRAVVAGERNVSVKQLRLRLAAVTSIQRITKTMKMVAAAKLKGFQTRMIAARPLGEQINFLVSQIPPPAEEVEKKEIAHLFVPITSDRGLCGGVNNAVAKAVRLQLAEMPDTAENKIAIIGSKGEALLKRMHGEKIVRVIADAYAKPTSFALASEIAEELLTCSKTDKTVIVYNKFLSAIAYETMTEEIESPDAMEDRLAQFGEKYEFDDEFTESLHMQDMMQFALASKLYSRILEGATSEVSARMQAMENATKNCGDMMSKLTVKMNKARQAVITQELSEIVSGAACAAEG